MSCRLVSASRWRTVSVRPWLREDERRSHHLESTSPWWGREGVPPPAEVRTRRTGIRVPSVQFCWLRQVAPACVRGWHFDDQRLFQFLLHSVLPAYGVFFIGLVEKHNFPFHATLWTPVVYVSSWLIFSKFSMFTWTTWSWNVYSRHHLDLRYSNFCSGNSQWSNLTTPPRVLRNSKCYQWP